MRRKKTLLLTNDDGINAKGIKLLFDILKNEYHVIIVAPDSEKSGVSHSFTYHHPLFYEKLINSYATKIYSITGSPADCVKFAISHLLPELPNVIVSGLNIGENSGVSSYYSGTVAAAREGAFWNIVSIAFSVCEESEKYSSRYVQIIPRIINEILKIKNQIYENIFFNINFPSCSPDEVKGIKITRQSMAFFNEKYKKISSNYNGKFKEGYKIYGKKVHIESSNEFDSRALMNGWITITPLSFDSTAYKEILKIKNLENKFIVRE